MYIIRKRISLPAVVAIAFILAAPLGAQQPGNVTQREVAVYVRDAILGGDFGERTLWMTPAPIDPTHVVRDPILERKFDLPVPYPQAWLVMIDDYPEANFAHPVRWLFVDAALTKHTEPVRRDLPPLVLTQGGAGPAVPFRCAGVTSTPCPETAVLQPAEPMPPPAPQKDSCLYAVLVSGGINAGANYARYPQNLKSMYGKLRNCGYPKANIYVYYADGNSLDLDNADGDNNDATGSDVTAGANEAAIRNRIQTLCQTLDKDKDILFTYFTNHGADDTGVCLWDGGGNGLDANELYSPAELAADTANCSVCRHFMLHDQCFAGDFLPMASDGQHANLAVYAAASATEFSWGREYMARWETNDPATKTMNEMHQDVAANGNLTSTPGKAEGTAGIGDNSPCECCEGQPCSIVIIVIIVIVIVIVIIVIVIIIIRRRRQV